MNWTDIELAVTGTHHLRGGEPLYAARFDAVGKFHAPGLAPVRVGGEAWHIDVEGRPAYEHRFHKAFGFYEGRAAVDDGEAWFHVDRHGRAIGTARHVWCGNFQEGRAVVRGQQGEHFHVDGYGQPIYAARWRYVGDYRDGRAVVQSALGLSTHIDRAGEFVHGAWFEDLDVYHKGWARARDAGGWTHVDAGGRAGYRRRFAAVEPFYNGQARVETFEGACELIDERGDTIAQLRDPRRSCLHGLSRELIGIWRTRSVAAAVELGIFDRLPASELQLAEACALPCESLRRLLRALAELDLVTWVEPHWQARPKGELLALAHPSTLADAALDYAGPLDQPWQQLVQILRAPDEAGSSWFETLACAPRWLRSHHRALHAYALHDYAGVGDLDLWRPGMRVIDAGGGTGALAGMLVAQHPALDVALLDRPEVLALVGGIPAGLRLHPADLFEPWGICADVVILARVLHDWSDVAAQQILMRAREALDKGGWVIVIEMVLDDLYGTEAPHGGLCDLHLLVTHRGREREGGAWATLLASAGFCIERIVPLGVPRAIVARPS